MAAQKKPTLIGVDTNVLYNRADEDEDTIDALATIRARLPGAEFVIPMTAAHEIANEIRSRGAAEKLARIVALEAVSVWGFRTSALAGVKNGIAEYIGHDLRNAGLLPMEEKNDALIAAESAVEGFDILLTNDAHLLDMHWQEAQKLVREYGYRLPVISRPRKIVQSFFKK